MEGISTYSLLGIPDAVSTTLVLICLCLCLAPWLGGLEIGTLKIPRLSERGNRAMRVAGPLILVLFTGGFMRLWENSPGSRPALTWERYQAQFFDSSKAFVPEGRLFPLNNELETQEFEDALGNTKWKSDIWGTVLFDPSGRIATYTNQEGRAPGRILIQGAPPGTVPLIIGEWHQDDGQNGPLVLFWPRRDKGELTVAWGPGLKAVSRWKRIPPKNFTRD